MDYALLESWYREKIPNLPILLSVLCSVLLHVLLLTKDLGQSAIPNETKNPRQTLKIEIQPQSTRSSSHLSPQTQDIGREVTGEPTINEAISEQAPSQNDIPVKRFKDNADTSSKAPQRLDIIHLDDITSDVVKKLVEKEHEESSEPSIFEKNKNLLGEDLPILPQLDRALKRKHFHVQKFSDGLIQIVLPSGRTYCLREAEGFDINSPSAIPPVATNCP
jgi:hypothetical protein